MRITTGKHFEKWAVIISQGAQMFYMDKTNREEARWYAKMFKIALRKHDEEQKENYDSTHKIKLCEKCN